MYGILAVDANIRTMLFVFLYFTVPTVIIKVQRYVIQYVCIIATYALLVMRDLIEGS
jgi:hypothetical protein